jgi:HlyD family secretion protein
MVNPSSGLEALYERCLTWLRSPRLARSRRFGGHKVSEPSPTLESVDLVGGDHGTTNQPTTFGRLPTPSEQASAQPAPAPGLARNPLQSSTLTANGNAPTTPWTFSQTVLLRKQNRSSSVLVWTGIGTVAALGLWAVTAPLAETIAVEGKLEPGIPTKRIDTPVPGVVEAVLVKEGQKVRKGDPLVRFDLREPRSRLATAESIRSRLLNENQIAAATLGDATAGASLTANQRLQLASQDQELASRREAARQELRKSQERLAGQRASLATYQNIANRFAGLVAQGAASEVQLLEARQRVQETESSIAQEQREIARLESSLINTSATTNLELRRKVEENLRQIAQLDNDIRLARQQIQFGQLTAPANGTVFDIEVSPGSVVAQGTGTSASASGKSLMKVVPDEALRARVYLPNQAIGFVQPGQRADLQIQAFNASDFGTVPAVVERIGSDALPAEEQQRVLGTDSSGLYYPAVMRLERQSIPLGNSEAPLQAGMSLTANITLRERRFINVFTGFFEDQRRNLERMR